MEEHHFEEEIGVSGGRLELRLEVGSAKIVGGKGGSVVIDAETEWMDVDVGRKDNVVKVTILVAEEARTLMGQIASFLTSQRPRAEATIAVPFDCQVDARVTTGRLRVETIDGPVQARVTTGQISLADLSDTIEARVVTGKIAYRGGLSDDEHQFQATTGTLRIDLPDDAGAELDLQTMTGSVHCARRLTERSAQGHLVGGRLRGVLGDGRAHIRGRVVTGSISVGSIREKVKTPKEVIR